MNKLNGISCTCHIQYLSKVKRCQSLCFGKENMEVVFDCPSLWTFFLSNLPFLSKVRSRTSRTIYMGIITVGLYFLHKRHTSCRIFFKDHASTVYVINIYLR